MFDRIFSIVWPPALRGSLALFMFALPAADAAATYIADPPDRFMSVIQRELDDLASANDEEVSVLREWYTAPGHQALWIGPDGFNGKADRFLEILSQADREGLSPRDYPVERIRQRMAVSPAEGEVLLSSALVHYVSDLRTGRLSPRTVDPTLFLQPGEIDRTAILQAARDAPDITRAIEGFTPANPFYHRLRRVLAEYRTIALNGGWPLVPEGPSLKPGMRDWRVTVLRRRLMATKDLVHEGEEPDLFDEALAQAVERFQARHGLEIDGVVGKRTLAELNIPVQRRIEQIVVNMERWRWMPDDLGERYILVNLAGFELEVVEYGSVVMSMRIVAGQPYRRTPVFSGSMTYLEFNPTWTVPPVIVKHDILPKLREDPAYLERRNIRVFLGWDESSPELAGTAIDWAAVNPRRNPYRFRQDPGADNALGRVKFMLPNQFGVYLHDTPARELFGKRVRSFSSGCVRLEKPIELAEYLLSDLPGWSRKRIDQAIDSHKTVVVRLARPVPVYLSYSTVWIGEGGTIHFRDDVYARDDLLFQALFGYPPSRKQVPQDR